MLGELAAVANLAEILNLIKVTLLQSVTSLAVKVSPVSLLELLIMLLLTPRAIYGLGETTPTVN
jgi:hypothetical protein